MSDDVARRSMRLRPLHRDELKDIAKRGSATALAVILFWTITAPALFFDKTLEDIYKPEDEILMNRNCVAMTTIVVVGCFWSSYRNLLTPDLSESERKLGFVMFWSIGSYCCECVWFGFFSEFHASLFATARLPLRGLPWHELTHFGNYQFSWNESFSMIRTMDFLHLACQAFFCCLGCGKYGQQARNESEYREALFWFCVLGIFQCCSFVQSIVLSFRMDGQKGSWPDPDSSVDQCILWSIRLFPVLGALTSATFAYQLLFDKGEGQVRQ